MKIIDTYDKLPLGTYLDIVALCEDPDITEDDRQLQIISLLTGEDTDTLLRMPILDFKALAKKAQFLETEIPHPAAVPKCIRVGGLDLIPTTKVTKITTAQFVDFQTFSKDHHRLVEQLSCFLIPAGCKYNEDYEMDYVHGAIRDHLTVTQAQGLAAFFFSRWVRLCGSSLIYSAWMARRIKDRKERERMKAQIRQALAVFRSAGDGSTTFALSLIPPVRRGTQYGG